MSNIVRGIARGVKTNVVRGFDSALRVVFRLKDHVVVQNQQLRDRVGDLEHSIEALEFENQRLRDRLDASEAKSTERYREIIMLENEVGRLKTGWDAVSKDRLVKDLRDARVLAFTAKTERDRCKMECQAERNIRRVEQDELFSAMEEQQCGLINTIDEQKVKIERLYKLVGEQQDQISRLQVEVGREKREKESVQLVLRRFVPDGVAKGVPLPSPDPDPLPSPRLPFLPAVPSQPPKPSHESDTSDEGSEQWYNARTVPHGPNPDKPPPVDTKAPKPVHSPGSPASPGSPKTIVWKRMRDEHRRAVEEEATQ